MSTWNQLKFNQIGLIDLPRRIGLIQREPHIYNHHRTQFDAADIAWFASGLSSEILYLAPNKFPPELNTLRDGMGFGSAGSMDRLLLHTHVKKVTFDLVCILIKSVTTWF